MKAIEMLETEEKTLDDLPIDTDGSIAFAANQAHVRTLKICLTAALAGMIVAVCGVGYAVSRPPQVAIIRTDAIRGAELVRPPKTAALDIRTTEVRTALNQWCVWRYRLLKSISKEDFALSYYFLSNEISAHYRTADARKVAGVLAGTEPEQTVDIRRTALPPMKAVSRGSRTVLSGRAELILVTRENLSVDADLDTTKKRWLVNLEFVVDPIEAAKRGLDDPQFQVLNPLGITINSYYETRLPDGEGN